LRKVSVTRDATQHIELQAANPEKCNTFLMACGTAAACRWLPQVLALQTILGLIVERRTLAIRCVALWNPYGVMTRRSAVSRAVLPFQISFGKVFYSRT